MSELKIKKALKQEILMLKREKWRIDPMYWISDRLGEDPKGFQWSAHEGYEGHSWDGDVDPLVAAWKILGNSYKEYSQTGNPPRYRKVGIEAATGTSKTYWLARLVFWFLDCFENSLVVTSAPKQDQLKLGLWAEIGMLMPKVKRLRKHSKMYKLRLAMDESTGNLEQSEIGLDDAQNLDAWQAVGFVAGVGAEEQSANKARGFHRKNMLIILEECTGMPQPIITAFQNTSTGNMNFIVAVGNPDNEHDPLHRFCEQKNVMNFRISALDYPNIVLNKEIFPGAVTWASVNDRKDVYGEGSPLYQAMVRGISPAQSEDSLIKREWVEQCLRKVFPEEEKSGYNAVGVDVANSESGDKAALAWGVRNCLTLLHEFQCPNATHLAYNLLFSDSELKQQEMHVYKTAKIKDYNIYPDAIGVDAVGVGVATVNAFLDEGMEVQPLHGGSWEEGIPKYDEGKLKDKPMYRFNNLRSQMYWEAREDLRKGLISIDLEDKTMEAQLIKELCIPKYDTNHAHIAIESKEFIKKRLGQSPNVMDAFVYWNWTRKGYRIKRFTLPAMSAGV